MLTIAMLASGNGSNLQAIIDAIKSGELEARIAVVISDKENAFALERARREGIEALYLNPKGLSKEEFDDKLAGELNKRGVQLVVLAGFLRLVTKTLLEKYPNKAINLHPALLPSFKGIGAASQALEYGVKVTGCTVHFVDLEMDTGPIILQKAIEIEEDETLESLEARIHEEEHKLLPYAIQLIAEGRVSVMGRKTKILMDKC